MDDARRSPAVTPSFAASTAASSTRHSSSTSRSWSRSEGDYGPPRDSPRDNHPPARTAARRKEGLRSAAKVRCGLMSPAVRTTRRTRDATVDVDVGEGGIGLSREPLDPFRGAGVGVRRSVSEEDGGVLSFKERASPLPSEEGERRTVTDGEPRALPPPTPPSLPPSPPEAASLPEGGDGAHAEEGGAKEGGPGRTPRLRGVSALREKWEGELTVVATAAEHFSAGSSSSRSRPRAAEQQCEPPPPQLSPISSPEMMRRLDFPLRDRSGVSPPTVMEIDEVPSLWRPESAAASGALPRSSPQSPDAPAAADNKAQGAARFYKAEAYEANVRSRSTEDQVRRLGEELDEIRYFRHLEEDIRGGDKGERESENESGGTKAHLLERAAQLELDLKVMKEFSEMTISDLRGQLEREREKSEAVVASSAGTDELADREINLKESMTQVAVEASDLQKRCHDLEAELRGERDAHRIMNENSERVRSDLTEALSSMERERTSALLGQAEAEDRATRAEEGSRQARWELEGVRSELAEALSSAESERARAEEEKRKRGELERSAVTLKSELARKRSHMREKDMALRDLGDKLSRARQELIDKLDDHKAHLNVAQEEKTNMKKDNDALTEEVARSERQYKQAKKRVEKVEAELEKRGEWDWETEKDIEGLESELLRAREDIQKNADEQQEAQEEKVKMAKERDALTEEVARSRQWHEQVQKT